jgi:hypothetical protein
MKTMDDKEEIPVEVEFPVEEHMRCKRCDGKNLANGTSHNAGGGNWVRLFMCKDCNIESSL